MLLRRENSDSKAILAEKRNDDLNRVPLSLPSHAVIPAPVQITNVRTRPTTVQPGSDHQPNRWDSSRKGEFVICCHGLRSHSRAENQVPRS